MENFPDNCQRCGETTFYKKNNQMFFEVHHILPLSRGGEDKVDNLSKICPTCHREAHYGKKEKEIQSMLIVKTLELLEN